MFCMDFCNNDKKNVMISKSCQVSSQDIDNNNRQHEVYKELVDKMTLHKNHRIYL